MTLTFFILFSSILFLLFILVIFINPNFLILSNGYGQMEPLDDRSPSFLEAYWTNKPITSSQSQRENNSIKVEVGPGEGPSTLAVVLVNTGRSEITGITGDLTLPEGFKAIRGENDVKSENVSVASYNSIVKPGDSFPLYFTFGVLNDTKVGPYYGSMKITYSKVLETGQIVSNITVPFRVPGKVILDVILQKQNLITNTPNYLPILLYNKGSADANGVIVTITNISGGTTTIGNKDHKNNKNIIIDNPILYNNSETNNNDNNNLGNSNYTISNTSTNTTKSILTKPTSQKESYSRPLDIQATTFNVERILANNTALIIPVIYPGYSTGGTIQNMKLKIDYNDPYGNKKNLETSVGLIISPNPPESVLSIDEARNILDTNTNTDTITSNTTKNDTLMLRAGMIESAKIIVSNNGNEELKNVVFSLKSESDSVKLLGDTRWTLNSIEPFSKTELLTQIFSSEEVISKPISFTLDAEYISGGKSKRDSLSIGAYIQGQITIRTYDVSIENIGGVLNLVGNLLNEGNTVALFTTIEINNNNEVSSKLTSNSSQSGDLIKQLPLQSLPSPQYLGDLTENSPLPFSIPIDIKSNTENGKYMTKLKVNYKDALRTEHDLVLSETVYYQPVEMDQTNASDNSSSSILGFTISNFMTTIIVIFILSILIVITIIFVIVTIKKRKNKKSKLYKSLKYQDNDMKDFLGDKKDERG